MRVALVAVVFALIDGGLGAWATANMGISSIAFIIVAGVAGYFLWRKPIATEAIGSGMYITALLLILTPLLFYLPNTVGPTPETAYGMGTRIGSILGLVIWGFVFLLFALVVAGVGYFFKRRAESKLSGPSPDSQ